MKPNAIPVATLKVNGIIIMVVNAGMAMSSFVQSIWRTSATIMAPTIISAGAVISEVTTDNNGEKKSDNS